MPFHKKRALKMWVQGERKPKGKKLEGGLNKHVQSEKLILQHSCLNLTWSNRLKADITSCSGQLSILIFGYLRKMQSCYVTLLSLKTWGIPFQINTIVKRLLNLIKSFPLHLLSLPQSSSEKCPEKCFPMLMEKQEMHTACIKSIIWMQHEDRALVLNKSASHRGVKCAQNQLKHKVE